MTGPEQIRDAVQDVLWDHDVYERPEIADAVAELFEPHRMGMWDIEVPGLYRLKAKP